MSEQATPRRVLMTEPHDGHGPAVTCPGCPHEQTTPRTVEEAASEYVHRRHNPLHDVGVGVVQGSHYRAGFIAGAVWQAGRMPSVEEVAEVLCECDVACDQCIAKAEYVVALWGAL